MEIPPLTSIEQILKTKWQNHRLSDEEVITIEDFDEDIKQLLKLDVENHLEEDNYIDKDMDVSCTLHARYFPALYHTHTFFELACVLNGECTNHLNQKCIRMHKGDICIIAPDTVHAISAYSDETIVCNILIKRSNFNSSFLSLMNQNDILSNFFQKTFYDSKSETPYLIFHTQNDGELESTILNLYDESRRELPYKRRMINALLSVFFISLLRKHEKDVYIPTMQSSNLEDNFMFMMIYMQEHFDTVTLGELSSLFNYSERQLQRIIKNSTGKTFIENIQDLKMEKARELITKSSRSITDIAEECGYDSLNNFRAVFKKYYGVTPGEYKKSSR